MTLNLGILDSHHGAAPPGTLVYISSAPQTDGSGFGTSPLNLPIPACPDGSLLLAMYCGQNNALVPTPTAISAGWTAAAVENTGGPVSHSVQGFWKVKAPGEPTLQVTTSGGGGGTTSTGSMHAFGGFLGSGPIVNASSAHLGNTVSVTPPALATSAPTFIVVTINDDTSFGNPYTSSDPDYTNEHQGTTNTSIAAGYAVFLQNIAALAAGAYTMPTISGTASPSNIGAVAWAIEV